MKRERALVDSRRMKVLETLKNNGHIKASDLAEEFNVSPLTIRRDLQYLEENKKLERFYGGAALISEHVNSEEDEVTYYRKLIAKYAATLVDDGDSIFINTSFTALQMIQYIRDKRITVITNNGKAIYTDHSPKVSVILTGGEIREMKEAMVGEFAANNLERVSAKKSFLGCTGITVESGMTTELLNEVNINQLMLKRVSGSTYILADHTKLGHNSSFVSCSVNHIQNIITDELANPLIISALREKGIRVHIVSKNDNL